MVPSRGLGFRHMENPVCRLELVLTFTKAVLFRCGRAVLTCESGLVCKSKGLVLCMASLIGCVMLSIDECLLHEYRRVGLMVLRVGACVVGESELRALGGCLGAKRR